MRITGASKCVTVMLVGATAGRRRRGAAARQFTFAAGENRVGPNSSIVIDPGNMGLNATSASFCSPDARAI